MSRQSDLIKAMQYTQFYVVSVVRLFGTHVGRFTAQKEAHNDKFATECDRLLDLQGDEILFTPRCRGHERQQVLFERLRKRLDLEVEKCQCQLCLKKLYRDMLHTSLMGPLRDLTSP